MDRVQVSATKLRSVGYDFRHASLEIELADGSVYLFTSFPMTLHTEFMSAHHKDSFWEYRIKRRFPFKQLR